MVSCRIRQYVHLPDCSSCHLVCHLSMGLCFPSLRMASFMEWSPVGWSYKWASCGAERSPAFPSPVNLLVDSSPGPARHSSIQFSMLWDYSQRSTSLCRGQLFLDSMVIKSICSDWSRIKQLWMHDTRHQSSLGLPRSTNVGHEPSQVSSTLDGFDSRDLQVFAKDKISFSLCLASKRF